MATAQVSSKTSKHIPFSQYMTTTPLTNVTLESYVNKLYNRYWENPYLQYVCNKSVLHRRQHELTFLGVMPVDHFEKLSLDLIRLIHHLDAIYRFPGTKRHDVDNVLNSLLLNSTREKYKAVKYSSSNYQLQRMYHDLVTTNILHTCSANQLLVPHIYSFFVIINVSDENSEGTHWVVIWVSCRFFYKVRSSCHVEYFDSLAMNPIPIVNIYLERFKNLLPNCSILTTTERIQCLSTVFCGIYCLYYIYAILNSSHKPHLYFAAGTANSITQNFVSVLNIDQVLLSQFFKSCILTKFSSQYLNDVINLCTNTQIHYPSDKLNKLN